MNSILITLNQCINEWIKKIKDYITKLNDIGKYHLEEIWTEAIYLLNDININQTTNDIEYADILEYNYDILLKITKNIVIEKLNSLYNLNSILKEIDNYHNIIVQIYTNILDGILTFNDTIDIYTYHGTIVTFYMIIKDINTNKLLNMKIYKKIALNNDKSYDISSNLSPIKKVNYYIKPLSTLKDNVDTTNYFNINISNNIISYNVLPLFNIQKALKYGPIHNIDSGLDSNMIKRYENVTIEKKTTTKPSTYIDSIQGPAIIYTGAEYKELSPVYSINAKWKPLSGVNDNVYKYNELLFDQISKNMILNPIDIKNKNISENLDELKKELKSSKNKEDRLDVISSYCFNKINKTNRNELIKNEIYLYQYYNILDISSKFNTGNLNLITIMPSNPFFSKLYQ